MVRETSLSKHLVDIEYMAHMPTDRARYTATEQLCDPKRNLDMVIMIDSDQSAECAEDASDYSWIDRVVSQYQSSSWPYEILFGITRMSHDSELLNYWVEGWQNAVDSISEEMAKGKSIRQCGSGLIAIPKQSWMKVAQWSRHKGYGDPWYPAEDIPDSDVSEDIRMTRRAVNAGIRLVPMDGIRTYHWPTWNRELLYPPLPN